MMAIFLAPRPVAAQVARGLFSLTRVGVTRVVLAKFWSVILGPMAPQTMKGICTRLNTGSVARATGLFQRSEEHTSELQSHLNLVCRLLLEKKKHTSELQSHLNLVCRLLLEKKNKYAQLTMKYRLKHTRSFEQITKKK